MELIYRGGKFLLLTEYEERIYPKQAGFRWDRHDRMWYTTDLEAVKKLINKITPPNLLVTTSALEGIRQEEKKIQEALQASRATNTEIEIPAPDGLEYLPFQKAGIAYALQRENCLIADEMGLGKTIQALGVVNALPLELSRHVLIVCPASLKKNWEREANKWLVGEKRVRVVNGSRFEWGTVSGAPDYRDVVIINYDILDKHHKIKDIRWDVLICDEAHYLKNKKAKRTRFVLGAKDSSPIIAKKKLFLTGTPIVNRPSELYSLLLALLPRGHKMRDWKYFHERYCNAYRTRWGWDVSGASNLDELDRELRKTIMVRRLKEQVLKELPEKTRDYVSLSPKGIKKLLQKEQKAVQKALEALGITQEDFQERLLTGWIPPFEEIQRVRHELALKKVPAVVEFVRNMLESVQKVVVFAVHHDVIDTLLKELEEFSPVKLDGRDSQEARDLAVREFQENPSCRVFIGNIKAAGVGLTLNAASHVVFAEITWVPGELSQAEDRCHRIGQKSSVQVYYLVVEKSLEELMIRTILKKQRVIKEALGD